MSGKLYLLSFQFLVFSLSNYSIFSIFYYKNLEESSRYLKIASLHYSKVECHNYYIIHLYIEYKFRNRDIFINRLFQRTMSAD